MKSVSPLLGFNNNVKHKGKVFHIQTEDSGVKHPHVITHLFVDGGRILKSTKTSYAEFLEDEQLTTKVRQLMQEQHKAMFIALRAGKFDHLMDYGDAPSSSAGGPSSVAVAPPSSAGAPTSAAAPPSSAAAPPAAGPPPSSHASTASPGDGSTSGPGGALRPAPAAAERPATVREGRRDVDVRPGPASSGPTTERSGSSGNAPPSVRPTPSSAPRPPSLQPPPPRPSHPSMAAAGDRRADPRAETVPHMPVDVSPRLASPALELNLEALERSTGDVKPSSMPGSEIGALPPPPAAVLGRRAQTFNTGYRSIQTDARSETPARGGDAASGRTPTPAPVGGPSSVREPPRGEPPRGEPPRPRVATPMPARAPTGGERRSLTPSGARYAPSRPASIFGSARPQEGSSIFGEDLISEKSLDEVILSYLAEDLDGSKPKR